MNSKLLIIALLALMPCLSQAETRLWKNANATRSFSGELIKREADKVTIKMTHGGRIVAIKPANLHASDLEWLKQNHPLDGEKPAGGAGGAPQVAAGCFYDTLSFGDDKPTVIKKLKASPRFHSELDETFFARTGLNGTFRTTKGNEFFGMEGALYYGWNENHQLKFLSLYGHETPAAKVEAALVPTYLQMVGHINKHFGEAKSASPKPQYAGLGEGEITFSHAWPMKTGGSLLLGVGKQEGNSVIIARFTSEAH